MPSSRNYDSNWPWRRRKELPSLNAPVSINNGQIIKHEKGCKFQWCPSDELERSGDDWAHTRDMFFYTVNSLNYRAPEFKKEDGPNAIMCLGDSYTFGIGVSDEDTWPHKLSELSRTGNWNLGAGGSSVTDMLLMANQFISMGYIPDTMCILWPYMHRRIVSSSINNFISTRPAKHTNVATFSKEGYWDDVLELYRKDVQHSIELEDIGLAQRELYDVANTPYAQDLQHLQDRTDKVAAAGLMLSAQTDADYLQFYTARVGIKALCEAHNITLKEAFVEADMVKFVEGYIIPVEGWTTGKYAMWSGSLQVDTARDNNNTEKEGHYGPKTLTNIANYFYKNKHSKLLL